MAPPHFLRIRGRVSCLDPFFSSLNFRYSISITHHSKIPRLFDTITHLPSFNIFYTVCRPHIYHWAQYFFFSTQKPEPSEKKKKNKREEKTEPRRRKGKKKDGQKVMTNGSPCVFNYKNVIKL